VIVDYYFLLLLLMKEVVIMDSCMGHCMCVRPWIFGRSLVTSSGARFSEFIDQSREKSAVQLLAPQEIDGSHVVVP
jgi:hypothetical protein